MKNKISHILYLTLVMAVISSASLIHAQVRPYRVTDRQVQTLLTQIEQKTDTFSRSMDTVLRRGRLNTADSADMFRDYIGEFENATDRLKQRFDSRQSVRADVEDVLTRASFINAFMQRNSLNPVSQRNWTSIRTDLNTLATYYNVSWDWNRTYSSNPNNNRRPPYPGNTGGRTPYNVTDRQVQTLLSNIETRTDAYRRDMSSVLSRSTIGGSRSENAILEYITEFENATDRLKRNFDARNSTNQDVTEVLNRAYYIDSFMRDYRFGANTERNWTLIRSDLDTLSDYYAVSWNWDRQYEPMTRFDSMISGTYRLNLNESDNVREVVNRALNSYNVNQRGNLRNNLENRLQSPEMLVIEKRGNDVTVASTTAPQITFAADGVKRNEQAANGRNIEITARTTYDGVAINYEGDRMRDFYVNFMPMSNGKLRVVRRIYLENRNETITVASVYDKVNQTAQWSAVNAGSPNLGGNYGDFIVPNGTRVTARLDNMITTNDSQDGDRFTMTVTSPSQYNGAVISGRVLKADSSGRVSGRANISLDFDSIRLRNGQTYRFAGIIDGVTAANGDNVSVNNEGTVRDGNQTTRTVTRAGIGAALGAIIGAIAGGGEGAAIGAAVGAGAGAGTVFIQGRDNLELDRGSEFRLTATAPANIGSR